MRLARRLTTILATCLIASASLGAQQAGDHVLALHSYYPDFAWTNRLQRGIERGLARGTAGDGAATRVSVEYMDSKNHPGVALHDELASLYRAKYAGGQPDLIVSADEDALDFLFARRDELFPGVPVVFCGLNAEDYDPSLLTGREGYTGVVERLDIASTVELILDLHPRTKEIRFVQDHTTAGLRDRATVAELAERFEDRADLAFVGGNRELTRAELLADINALGPEVPLVFLGFFRDAAGAELSAETILPDVSAAADAPVYAILETYLGLGIAGGKLLSGEVHGVSTGAMAAEILAGTSVSELPVRVESSNRYMFDYRQLERHGIHPGLLPEESIVRFQPESLFERNRAAFVIGIVGLVLVAALIGVLTMVNLRLRAKERQLGESERKYRTLVDHQSDMVVQIDPEGRFLFVNPRYCELFGKAREELVGHTFLPLVHPDDQASTTEAMEHLARPPFTCYLEQRAMTARGWRWLAWTDTALLDEEGNVTSIIGVGQDITDRRTAEHDLQQALAAKDALMREMNHRIKNNLLMITALIKLKSREVDHADLSDIEHQIDAIRIVHEKLYQVSDIARIDMQPYLQQLLETVFASFAEAPVELDVRASEVHLPSKMATSLGLIVNEVATNAIKHGSPGGGRMRFACHFELDADGLVLRLANSGAPFPERVSLDNPGTLGLRIISMLVAQHGGTIDLRRAPYPEYTIRFPRSGFGVTSSQG